MTKTEKSQFVRNFLQATREYLLKTLDDVPEEWDGLELREWIADVFERERYMSNPYKRKGFRKRLAAYKNTVITHNL